MGVRAYIALGSNLGERGVQLERAVAGLRDTPGVRVVRVSRWIETAPVGGPPGQGAYLNGAAELDVELAPRALLGVLLALERAAGRVRGERDGPRTLDLDLLLYGELRLDEPGLILPHPRLEQRLFVLEPLAELAPQLRLPCCALSVSARLAAVRADSARATLAGDAGGGHPLPR